ncbi:MAG: hypothetical protein HYT83_04330, partial [Candidatus Levybacteria bacterium]|nr:hypothetical protein [Candidatus Levybacteria bacterium]
MDLLGKFKEYLFNQKNPASKITIKNYLADVNQFIRWFEEYFKTKFESSAVTPQIIELYKSAKTTTTVIANEVKQSHDLSADKAGIATSRLQRTRDDGNDNPRLSPRSLERHMSSLRKFFHFLKIEGIITSNPFELKPATHNLQPDPYYLKNFKDHLYVYNASALTIKNYIIDVKQFLNWAQEVTGV